MNMKCVWDWPKILLKCGMMIQSKRRTQLKLCWKCLIVLSNLMILEDSCIVEISWRRKLSSRSYLPQVIYHPQPTLFKDWYSKGWHQNLNGVNHKLSENRSVICPAPCPLCNVQVIKWLHFCTLLMAFVLNM